MIEGSDCDNWIFEPNSIKIGRQKKYDRNI